MATIRNRRGTLYHLNFTDERHAYWTGSPRLLDLEISSSRAATGCTSSVETGRVNGA
jgi:hypothetical protein